MRGEGRRAECSGACGRANGHPQGRALCLCIALAAHLGHGSDQTASERGPPRARGARGARRGRGGWGGRVGRRRRHPAQVVRAPSRFDLPTTARGAGSAGRRRSKRRWARARRLQIVVLDELTHPRGPAGRFARRRRGRRQLLGRGPGPALQEVAAGEEILLRVPSSSLGVSSAATAHAQVCRVCWCRGLWGATCRRRRRRRLCRVHRPLGVLPLEPCRHGLLEQGGREVEASNLDSRAAVDSSLDVFDARYSLHVQELVHKRHLPLAG
mmetsp:Transcript_38687/g.109376  ORF Transcript_38687/g.109376 Transcript_38687/m.109376 type:complete len:269 (-) Transcript_38687:55-861(-)